MGIERRKRRALITAQRYNYSYLMDVRVASGKLKELWYEALTCNAPLCAASEVSFKFGRII